MVNPGKQLARMLAVSVLLPGCGDRQPPFEPAERSPASLSATAPAQTAPASVAHVEALELSPGVREAMARTLSAALSELDLPREAPMNALDDFLRDLDAQHGGGRTGGPTRTSHR